MSKQHISVTPLYLKEKTSGKTMHEESYILVTSINWIDKNMFGMAMNWCQVSNLQLIMVIMWINYNWKDDDVCYNVCTILTHLAGFL